MNAVEEAQRAVERSRSQHYLNGWEDATAEITTAVDALRRLETELTGKLPSPQHRLQLVADLHALRSEIRLAQRIHDRAATWETRWTNAVQDALGLRAAAYGPGGSLLSGNSIRRTAWEG